MDILEVSKYWFLPANSSKHFNCSAQDDEEITQMFLAYLDLPFDAKDLTCYSDGQLLAYVILYDQLVRHFFRGGSDKEQRVASYHAIALQISLWMLDRDADTSFTPEQRCFLLLPLRHTFQESYLDIVIERIKSYREQVPEDQVLPAVYLRFWRATLLSYSKVVTAEIDVEPIDGSISDADIFDILDKGEAHDLTRAIENLSQVRELPKKNEFRGNMLRTLRQLGEYDGVTVSVSGGVDSMVCCFVLHHCLQNSNKQMAAVMIDYGNRNSCRLECELVKRWCALLGIKLYIRHIKHLRRARSTERNVYEQVTREMRFHMYQKLGFPVILGHNYSDCEENILTNILKKKHYDDLRGMSPVSTEKDVTVIRPLLDIPKRMIYEFAKEFIIPHVYDSTPDWSMRGQMRNTLIPAFDSVDKGFMPALTHLSDMVSSMYADITASVQLMFQLFVRMDETDERALYIDVGQHPGYYSRSFAFWQKVVLDITREKHLSAPTAKSVKSFCERIRHGRYGEIRMSSEFSFDFNETGLALLIKR